MPLPPPRLPPPDASAFPAWLRADAAAVTAALTGAPAARFRPLSRLARRLGLLSHRACRTLEALAGLPAAEVSAALSLMPALEPRPRGAARLREAADPSAAGVRQGHLGDCWFIAALAACELTRPGFITARIRALDNGLVQVRLHTGVKLSSVLPGTRAPELLAARWVTLSPFLPERHRAGDERLRANPASLVEKAAAVTFGRGSYTGLQHGFAGNAFALLTGRIVPARPVPGLISLFRRSAAAEDATLRALRGWLAAGRPVVASTLLRPRSVRVLPMEADPRRSFLIMSGHVYVVCGLAAVDEDGRPAAAGALRIHVRNPLGGADPPAGARSPRRTDLFLSPAQFRSVFLSVNVGPQL